MTNEEFNQKIEQITKQSARLNTFEKNILAIYTYATKLAKMLLEVETNKEFMVFRGADPLAINIVASDGSAYMYDEPVSDVTLQLTEFEKAYSRYKALFIYGVGNGVLLKSLLGNETHRKIVVFEPEIEILYIALQTFDFSKELLNSRLFIVNSEIMSFPHYYALVNYDDIFNSGRLYNLYINRAFYNKYSDDMSGINDNFTKAFKQRLSEIGNDSTDALIGVNNTTINIPAMLSGIPLNNIIKARKNKVKTAVIVSTGPSLTKQLPLLRKIREHASIFCVDASYPILKKEGIIPDYVATIERVPLTSTFFDSKPSKFDENIIFLAATLTHEKTAKNMRGRNACFVLRPLAYEMSFKDNDFGYMGGGQSAANLAFDLAQRLGHNKIVFIGQDLAFGKDTDTTHAAGHIIPKEKDNPSLKTSREKAPAYGGKGEVTTTAVWNLFRQYFENAIATNKDKNLEFYNCTEGGARIAGTIEKPFSELVEIALKENKPKMPLPKTLNERQKNARLKRYSKHILSIFNYGDRLQKKAQKLFLKLAKQVEKAKALKAQNKENKIDYLKLQKLAFELDNFKELLTDKKYTSTYFSLSGSYIKNQELEFNKILARPSDTDAERKDKLFEWISVQGSWLFTIAGMISVMNENIIKSSKKWLIKEF